ncbi:MAG: sodium:proton antiporter [Acidobacteria bacterium]|jgi:multicomponent Na+:H+ antiporter subunit B|nr:sodium:proton antiporter [Acidobacteriota bacterium]
MVRKDDNPILIVVSLIASPLIMLLALYVIFHGHYSPGGGFQGGTMLAAAVLLVRLAVGSELGQIQFKKSWGTILGAVGVLIYFGTGFLAMLLGGNYLNYEFLPLPFDANVIRGWGILSIEIGVGLAVMGILVAIYDDLLEGEAKTYD